MREIWGVLLPRSCDAPPPQPHQAAGSLLLPPAHAGILPTRRKERAWSVWLTAGACVLPQLLSWLWAVGDSSVFSVLCLVYQGCKILHGWQVLDVVWPGSCGRRQWPSADGQYGSE